MMSWLCPLCGRKGTSRSTKGPNSKRQSTYKNARTALGAHLKTVHGPLRPRVRAMLLDFVLKPLRDQDLKDIVDLYSSEFQRPWTPLERETGWTPRVRRYWEEYEKIEVMG